MNILKLKKINRLLMDGYSEIILEGKAINISSKIRPYINSNNILKIKSNLCISKLIKKN